MDKSEFAKLTAAIRTYYPKETILPNAEAMTLWYEQLKDLSYETACRALQRWVSISRWSPAISDLRQMAAETDGRLPDWSEGWEQVTRAISACGHYDAEGAFTMMDPITRQAARRIGWESICTDENVAATRAVFRQAYETIARRAEQDRQLPAWLIGERSQELING